MVSAKTKKSNRLFKRIVSFLVTICLLVAFVPIMNFEETLAVENNITASINGCAAKSGINLSDVISKSVSPGAAVSSIVISEGVVSALDFEIISSHMKSLRKLLITNTVSSVSEPPQNLVGASPQQVNSTLTYLELANVNSIPAGTFQFCTALSYASLPNAIFLGSNAFEGCISLNTLILGAAPPQVGQDVFNATSEYKTVYVPSTSINAYKTADPTNSAAQSEALKNAAMAIAGGALLDGSDYSSTNISALTDLISNQAGASNTWHGFTVVDSIYKPAVPSIVSGYSGSVHTDSKTDTASEDNESVPANAPEIGGIVGVTTIQPVAGREISDFTPYVNNSDCEVEVEWKPGGKTFAANTECEAAITVKALNARFATDTVFKLDGEEKKVELNTNRTEAKFETIKSVVNAGTGQVDGLCFRVFDASDASPIVGALVSIKDMNADARTGEDGSVVISGINVGAKLRVKIAANGYIPHEQAVEYDVAGREIRVSLTPNSITEVVVSPSDASVEKGKTQQFTADVLTANGVNVAGVTWSILGDHHSDTNISEKGLLRVSDREKAKNLTVAAVSKADGITEGTVEVTLNDPPAATEIKNPVTIPVPTPVTGEKAEFSFTTPEFVGIIEWSPALTGDGKFLPLRKYTASVIAKATEGYKFNKDTKVEVIDSERSYDILVDKNAPENTLSFKVVFPSTFNPSYETQKNFAFTSSFPKVKTYGDSNFTVYARGGNGRGAITYKSTDEKVLKIVSNGTSSASVKVVGVGSAKIVATKAGDNTGTIDYNPITITSEPILVVPKVLKATAKDLTIHQDTNPKFTVVVTGFVNGDTEESLRASGYQQPVAESSETEVGIFPIVVSGGAPTANYVFDYYDGKIKIVDKNTIIDDNAEPDILKSNDTGTEITAEKIEGTMFEDGTELVVKDITKDIDPNDRRVYDKAIMTMTQGQSLAILYDITLKNGENAVENDGKTRVSISIPQNIRDNYRNFQIVYIDDDSKVSIIESSVAYNKISFTTDHFSKYGIIGNIRTASNNPQTGDTMFTPFNLCFVGLGLVALAVLMFMPKRSKSHK